MSHPKDLHSDQPYTYDPLEDATTIRLLRVLPDRQDGLLVCLLEHFSAEQLSTLPDESSPPGTFYTALSYVWGNTSRATRPIKLGNSLDKVLHDHEIHENIWQILSSLQSDPQWCNVLYWTDCLCLDQKSTAEKSQQVPRMKDIYSKAAFTMAWLQEDQDPVSGSPISFDILFDQIGKWIKHAGRSAIEAQIQSITSEFGDNWTWYVRDPNSFFCKPITWPGDIDQALITRFFKATYWTRVWIVQEVALSRRILIRWGTSTLPVEDLLLAYKVHMIKLISGRDAWFPEGGEIRGIPAIEARLKCSDSRNFVTFQDVLEWTKACKSSKAADRLYGLMGLMTYRIQDSEELSSWIGNLDVNSEKDVKMVLWDFILEDGVTTENIDKTLESLSTSFGSSDLSVRALQALIRDPLFSQRHRDLAQVIFSLFWRINEIFEWIRLPEEERPSLGTDAMARAAKIAVVLHQRENSAHNLEPAARLGAESTSDLKYQWRCGVHRAHGALESTEVVVYESAKLREPFVNRFTCEGENCGGDWLYLESDEPRYWFKCSRYPGLWDKLVLERAASDSGH